MESFPQILGLTSQEFIQLVILAIGLLIGLFILRAIFKLTATVLRMGCIGIALIVGVILLLQLFSF